MLIILIPIFTCCYSRSLNMVSWWLLIINFITHKNRNVFIDRNGLMIGVYFLKLMYEIFTAAEFQI